MCEAHHFVFGWCASFLSDRCLRHWLWRVCPPNKSSKSTISKNKEPYIPKSLAGKLADQIEKSFALKDDNNGESSE